MTKFHVLAAMGDLADELRSLGIHEAPSAHSALARCLAQLDNDPIADHEASLFDLEVIEMASREHQQLRDALAEPDVPFIVTAVAVEAHFMRDYDGVVKLAAEAEQRRAFGVDAGLAAISWAESMMGQRPGAPGWCVHLQCDPG